MYVCTNVFHCMKKTTSELTTIYALLFQLTFDWFANPIIGDGDYSVNVKEMSANISLRRRETASRLPSLTVEELTSLKGNQTFIH